MSCMYLKCFYFQNYNIISEYYILQYEFISYTKYLLCITPLMNKNKTTWILFEKSLSKFRLIYSINFFNNKCTFENIYVIYPVTEF